jgi:hypothetical protein
MALSDERKEEEKQAGIAYHQCPKCKRRFDLSRRWCSACHARLGDCGDSIYWSDDTSLTVAGPVNVDFTGVSCDDCGAGCKICYSFSSPQKNSRGFGGKDCERRQDDLKCACCQGILRNGMKLADVKLEKGANFFKELAQQIDRNITAIVLGMRDRWTRRGE